MKNLARIALSAALIVGGTVAAADQARAATYKSFQCAVAGTDYQLGTSFLRTLYGGGKSAITANATQSWKQDLRLQYDVVWTFSSFTSSTGLQSRYASSTTWGSSTNPLPLTNETITTKWTGRNTAGGTGYVKTCTATVGY